MKLLLFFLPFIATAAQVTLGAGDAYYGVGHGHLAGTVTITSTGVPAGGITQRAFVYFDPGNSNAFTVRMPPGMNASCSGATCTVIVAGATVPAPFGSCSYSEAWPKATDGTTAVGMVACWDINASGGTVWLHPVDGNNLYSYGGQGEPWGVPEGCDCMFAGVGPGPIMVLNNHIEGSGNIWHFDNAGYNWSPRGDYTIKRNTFMSPLYSRPMDAAYDGHRYLLRQLTEWKGGDRLYLEGNQWEGSYNDVADNALTIAFATRDGYGVRNVWMNYNELRHIPGGVLGAQTYDTHQAFLGLPKNFRFTNNLLWDINGTGSYSFYKDAPGDPHDANGWLWQGADGSEDLVIDHNTVVGNQGRVPVILRWQTGIHAEGLQVTNNVFSVENIYKGVSMEGGIADANGTETCAHSLSAEASWNCIVTNGLWKNNLMIPMNSSISCPKDNFCNYTTTQANLNTSFPTLKDTNYVTATTALGSQGWQKYQASIYSGTPDFHFSSTSAYISGGASHGTDGKDVGVDIEELYAREGRVQLIGVVAGSTSATVNFTAPDTQGCPVDYSTSSDVITSFTRVTDAGTARARSVSLTGLSAHTTYYFRLDCAVDQPTGVFRTL
jgi:hypothetical protein